VGDDHEQDGQRPQALDVGPLMRLAWVAPAGAGLGFLEAYLGRHLRRHNSFHSIYRAQRMVAPPGQLAARG